MRLWKTAVPAAVIAFVSTLFPETTAAKACDPIKRQDATKALKRLVETDTMLKYELAESIRMGRIVNPDPHTNPVGSIEEYYDFIDALTTYSPQNIMTGSLSDGIRVAMDGKNYCNWNILDMLSYSYFLVDRQITTDPRGQIQFKSAAFSEWMRSVADAWGAHLEKPESAKYIPDFTNDPIYGKWFCPKTPYASFHEFFTRELCREHFKTGSRKVHGYEDPLTVVSIGDSTPAGWWPISRDGKIVTTYDTVAQSGRVIKGKLYSDVREFIAGGPDETVLDHAGHIDPSLFDGGVWTHQFLDVNNYHRLHTPIAGKLVYMRHFQAGTRMKAGWKAALSPGDIAHYDPQDTADWQFGQTRMVIGIETPEHGHVIIAPMGMAQVDGIVLRDWVKDWVGQQKQVDKGWEFSNFAFGGSDFVVIFEKKADFVLTAPAMKREAAPGAGVNYKPIKQGRKYGCFGGSPDCGDTPKFPPKPPHFGQ